MHNYIDKAFSFRHGVCIGCHTVSDANTWAEFLVQNNTVPEEWMWQLLVAKTPNDVVETLGFLLSKQSEDEAWNQLKKLLGQAIESKKIAAENALHYAENYSPIDAEWDIFSLLQDYDDLYQGYGERKEVNADVLRFFQDKLD